MKRSARVIFVVSLIAVGIVGVVYAGAKSSEKTAGIENSVVAPVSNQQDAKATEKTSDQQNLAVGLSPEPCSIILVGVGGLIFLIGKKRRQKRRRMA